MKQPHFFAFSVTCLVAASVATVVPLLSLAQGEPVNSSPVLDPLLRTVLGSAPSGETGESPVLDAARSASLAGTTPSPLPESKPSETPSSTRGNVPDSLPVPSLSAGVNAPTSPTNLPLERKDYYKGQEGVTPVADPGKSGFFRKGRVGGRAGYVTGSDIDGGYTGRIELDLPIFDYPCFISVRGEYLSTDGGEYTKTWKRVYGTHGYSHYIYTDKYMDATDTSYGGSAAFLWNPIRCRLVSIYGGIGFIYQKTEREAEVSRTRVDNYTYDYGKHWGRSRSYYGFHEDGSDNNSAMVFRVGSSLCLWNRDILGAEVSYMPDLYDDSSECELRGNYLLKFTDDCSLDFFLEYRTEAKIVICGIGMSVWY